MTKEVQSYLKFWSEKKAQLEREIASKKRSLELAIEKLSNPEFHLSKELKRGAVKASKIVAGEAVKNRKPILIKKEVVSPAVAPVVPDESETSEKDFSWNPFK